MSPLPPMTTIFMAALSLRLLGPNPALQRTGGLSAPLELAGLHGPPAAELVVRPDCRPRPAALRPLFIPRRVIHPGNRNAVQAEIDAQDRTVVDQVVEDEAPNHGRSRHREDRCSRVE